MRGGVNEKIRFVHVVYQARWDAPLAGRREDFCRKAGRVSFGLAGAKQSSKLKPEFEGTASVI